MMAGGDKARQDTGRQAIKKNKFGFEATSTGGLGQMRTLMGALTLIAVLAVSMAVPIDGKSRRGLDPEWWNENWAVFGNIPEEHLSKRGPIQGAMDHRPVPVLCEWNPDTECHNGGQMRRTFAYGYKFCVCLCPHSYYGPMCIFKDKRVTE